MIVIGIILLLLGLALGGFIVAGALPGQAGTDVTFSLFGLTVETSAVVVFALGALTLLLLELGVLALRSGARSTARRRAELQRLRRVEAEVQARQSAEAQRNATTAAPAATSPAPFARREPDASSRPEPTRTDTVRPDSTRTDSTRTDSTRPESTRPGSTRTGDQTGSHSAPAAGSEDAVRPDERATRIGSADDRPPAGPGTSAPETSSDDSSTRTDRP